MSSFLFACSYCCNLWNNKILTFFLPNFVCNTFRTPTVSQKFNWFTYRLDQRLFGRVSTESTQPSNGLVTDPENEAERVPANNGHSGPPEQQDEDEDEGDDEVDLGEESDDVSILHFHLYMFHLTRAWLGC